MTLAIAQKPSSGITRDEWLNALREAGLHDEDDPGALTVMEFAALMGYKRTAAHRRLLLLVQAGKAKQTTKRMSDGQGRRLIVTAYRLQK